MVQITQIKTQPDAVKIPSKTIEAIFEEKGDASLLNRELGVFNI